MRHRPRAHREDVAQDAADAGRRPLIGLDEGGVVVALHLEHGDQAVADVDHAGVLARPLHHPGRLGRELAQVDLRGLVGAVLAPHHREDAELDQVRLAAQDRPGCRSYSSGLSLCSATSSGVIAVMPAPPAASGTGGRPSRAAQQRLDRPLGMRHQPQHVARSSQHAGDVGGRAVGVVAVAEGDPVLVLQPLQPVAVDDIVAVVVRHRQPTRAPRHRRW